MEARHVSYHYSALWKRRRLKRKDPRYERRGWPKLTVAIHAQSHLIAGSVITPGPSPDYPQFRSVLTQANRKMHFDEVLADAGYDSEANHRWAREKLKIPLSIIPAADRGQRGGRRKKIAGFYRRQMKKYFPVRKYRQRSQVESVFSQYKRRLDSFLRARTWHSQVRECLLKVLVHNFMILANICE